MLHMGILKTHEEQEILRLLYYGDIQTTGIQN